MPTRSSVIIIFMSTSRAVTYVTRARARILLYKENTPPRPTRRTIESQWAYLYKLLLMLSLTPRCVCVCVTDHGRFLFFRYYDNARVTNNNVCFVPRVIDRFSKNVFFSP